MKVHKILCTSDRPIQLNLPLIFKVSGAQPGAQNVHLRFGESSMSLSKNANRLRMQHRRERAKCAPGKDGKEATVLVSLRLPITLVGRIERLTLEAVAKGTYPWRSKNAAYKSIIVSGLRTLKGTSDTVDEFLPYLEVRASLDQIGSARVDAEALLSKSRTELTSLIDVGARAQAIQYFHTVRNAAERMPPTVYRDWLITKLNEEFKDLAKSKPQGVTLVKGHRRSQAV